jgi:protein-tyrosine kinase
MSRIHEALKRAEQESKSLPSTAVVPREGEAYLDNVLIGAVVDEPHASVPQSPVAPSAKENGVSQNWVESIPRSEWKPDPKKLLFSDPNRHYEPGMEEFRTLRSRLYQLREKMPLKKIMVASALPGEGKTFVSSNLAYVLVRQHGRRVLMIDADVRKCHMHECFGTASTPGLNEYLAGEVDETGILQRGPLDNLYLIPGGRNVANPSELITNGRFKVLLEKLTPLFDWILVDSPPVIPISDGTMIARHVDGVILVVRAEGTPVEVTRQAKHELQSRPLLGVVLNRGEDQAGYSSYYYTYGAKKQINT